MKFTVNLINSIVKAAKRFSYNNINDKWEKVEYSNVTLYNPVMMMSRDDEGYAMVYDDEDKIIYFYHYIKKNSSMDYEDLIRDSDANNRDELSMMIMRFMARHNII